MVEQRRRRVNGTDVLLTAGAAASPGSSAPGRRPANQNLTAPPLAYALMVAACLPVAVWRIRPLWTLAATGTATLIYLGLGYAVRSDPVRRGIGHLRRGATNLGPAGVDRDRQPARCERIRPSAPVWFAGTRDATEFISMAAWLVIPAAGRNHHQRPARRQQPRFAASRRAERCPRNGCASPRRSTMSPATASPSSPCRPAWPFGCSTRIPRRPARRSKAFGPPARRPLVPFGPRSRRSAGTPRYGPPPESPTCPRSWNDLLQWAPGDHGGHPGHALPRPRRGPGGVPHRAGIPHQRPASRRSGG